MFNNNQEIKVQILLGIINIYINKSWDLSQLNKALNFILAVYLKKTTSASTKKSFLWKIIVLKFELIV